MQPPLLGSYAGAFLALRGEHLGGASVGDAPPQRGVQILSTFSISRTGGLAASPGSCRILAGRGQNRRKGEVRHACVVVDV